MLPLPEVHDGVPYHILNFKGVGADAGLERMVMRMDAWYSHAHGRWHSRINGDHFGRRWGMLLEKDGKKEFGEQVMPGLGIQITPYLRLNEVPDEICMWIAASNRLQLAQIVRGLRTNIRPGMADMVEEHGKFLDILREYCDIPELAAIDSSIATAQLKLAGKGMSLKYLGKFRDNRTVDGRITDEENARTIRFDAFKAAATVIRAVTGWKGHFTAEQEREYSGNVLGMTGLDVSAVFDGKNGEVAATEMLEKRIRQAHVY